MTEKRIIDLFVSRKDCYALQNPDGSYTAVREELTPGLISRHLLGEITLGSYTLDENSMIKNICYDVDRDVDVARAIFNYLKGHTIYKNACCLESTGGRGWHVWQFFDQKIPSWIGKTIGERITEKLKMNCEIFPKQDSLILEKCPRCGYPLELGNLVKLPLGVHRKYGRRSVIIEPGTLDEISPATVPRDEFENVKVGRDKESWRMIPFSGCTAITRINQGVDEGYRDEAAFFKARLHFMIGSHTDEAIESLKVWNRRNRPPLDERKLSEKVRSVYSKGRYPIRSWSLRKNGLLSFFCEGCSNPVCEKTRKKRKQKLKLGAAGGPI